MNYVGRYPIKFYVRAGFGLLNFIAKSWRNDVQYTMDIFSMKTKTLFTKFLENTKVILNIFFVDPDPRHC